MSCRAVPVRLLLSATQMDLILFVVYSGDDLSWAAYLDALPKYFPRSRVGSPITDLDSNDDL